MGKYPVSAEHPVTIEIHTEYDNENGTGRGFELLPAFRLEYDDKYIANFPVKEKVNLAKFIRKFGNRLESNFETCQKYLSQALRVRNKVEVTA